MALIRSKQLNKTMSGDFTFFGSNTFVQTSSAQPAIIVSGSEEIVVSHFSGSAYSGSLFIQGLGTFADTGSEAVVDLGSY
jgi:hypothetical protein